MKTRLSKKQAGLTLVEMVMGSAVATAVGLAAFGFLNAGMYLSAKNFSLNMTSNQMRGTLDRVEQVLQQGDTNPILIDTSGNATTGSAAGVKFDRYIDGPYVTDVLTTLVGSLAIRITRSTNSLLAKGPESLAGMVGNVIRLDGTDNTFRPRIGTTPVSAGSPLVAYLCPLASPLSATVLPTTGNVLTAKLVRQVAFIVMPNGNKRELRYYNSIETTTNLNDPTKYTVITDQIGSQAADILPFSAATIGGNPAINFTLRVRSVDSDFRLLNKQSDEFNTFARVDSYLRPKSNPSSQ